MHGKWGDAPWKSAIHCFIWRDFHSICALLHLSIGGCQSLGGLLQSCYKLLPFLTNHIEPSDCRKITNVTFTWKKSIQKLWSLVSNLNSAQERTQRSSTALLFFLDLSKRGTETAQKSHYVVWSTYATAGVPRRTKRPHDKQTKPICQVLLVLLTAK